jgi:neutral ceramidase
MRSLLIAIGLVTPLWAAWQAGAALVDITPKESIWLAGYAARTQPSQSVRLPIHAKALALKDDANNVTVIVSLDLVGIRKEMSDGIAARAAVELHIPRERILFNVSHTHSAPLVGDFSSYLDPMGKHLEAQKPVIARYTADLPGLIFQAISKAVAGLQPASLSFEQGYAGFAVNRRRVGHREYPGPVDHDVPVLAVRNTEGRVIAILFGYACHNTVMGDYTIHGDYAGYAQQYLERRYPGSTALFIQGAGADSNPLPRGKPEHLERYGATLSDAVDQVINGKMKPLQGPIRAAMELEDVDFEGPFDRSRWEAESASSNARTASHGRRMLALLEAKGAVPEKRPYTIQVLQFADDLTLIGMAGELTVDYALKFKSRYGPNNTWIAGYTNDVFGYIPSLRVWKEGGYEGGEAFLFSSFPGRFSPDIENRVFAAVERAMSKVRNKAP